MWLIRDIVGSSGEKDVIAQRRSGVQVGEAVRLQTKKHAFSVHSAHHMAQRMKERECLNEMVDIVLNIVLMIYNRMANHWDTALQSYNDVPGCPSFCYC